LIVKMGYMLQKEERRMGGGNVSQDQTSIICIDLKSFYASVECVERGLNKMFGIDAELLIDHAWGYETCRMSDIKNYHSEEHSLSNGQVLMRNYSFDEALVIVREMTDNLVLDLFEKGLVTSSITLWIAYDHRYEHEA
jgi:nucleotidyltransferase/DNA polymerase involved in DNA repair